MPTAKYYLDRGLRSVDVALPVHLLAEFDRRVAEISFRSRNSMLAEAVLHFMTCDRADWLAGDQPGRDS
jgi:metal-responsive CopG/Arc/MetJ family transcriptional regulator